MLLASPSYYHGHGSVDQSWYFPPTMGEQDSPADALNASAAMRRRSASKYCELWSQDLGKARSKTNRFVKGPLGQIAAAMLLEEPRRSSVAEDRSLPSRKKAEHTSALRPSSSQPVLLGASSPQIGSKESQITRAAEAKRGSYDPDSAYVGSSSPNKRCVRFQPSNGNHGLSDA